MIRNTWAVKLSTYKSFVIWWFRGSGAGQRVQESAALANNYEGV